MLRSQMGLWVQDILSIGVPNIQQPQACQVRANGMSAVCCSCLQYACTDVSCNPGQCLATHTLVQHILCAKLAQSISKACSGCKPRPKQCCVSAHMAASIDSLLATYSVPCHAHMCLVSAAKYSNPSHLHRVHATKFPGFEWVTTQDCLICSTLLHLWWA